MKLLAIDTTEALCSAALLVDGVLPQQPMRQWVLNLPFLLRLLFAHYPAVQSQVLRIVYRTLAS